jgi:hypothetical protein
MQRTMARVAGWTCLSLAMIWATQTLGAPLTSLNGFSPWEAVPGRDGDFYGATSMAVYRFAPSGKARVINRFPQLLPSRVGVPWGGLACAKLAIGDDGAAYGVTRFGGVFGGGALFKVTPSGRITYLTHSLLSGDPGGFGAVFHQGNLYYSKEAARVVYRFSPDGRTATLPFPDVQASRLVSTSSGQLLVATNVYYPVAGRLWRLNASNGFDLVADLGDLCHALVPLADGAVLAALGDKIVRVASDVIGVRGAIFYGV